MSKRSEISLEAHNKTLDAIKHIQERFEQRLTIDNLRFVQRYLESDLHLLIRFTLELIPGEYIAHIERAPDFGLDKQFLRPEFSFSIANGNASLPVDSLNHLPSRSGVESNSVQASNGCDYHSMLVDIVKSVETPEHIIPSLVRFGSVNGIYRHLRHTLYLSTLVGFVSRGILRDWEGSTPKDLFVGCSVNQSELVGQVIQRRPEVEQDIAGDGENDRRSFPNAREIIDRSIRILRIGLSSDSIRIGVQEGSDFGLQIVEVLFGPFNFYADKCESFFDCHAPHDITATESVTDEGSKHASER